MTIMLKPTSPNVMPKEKASRIKQSGKSEKGTGEKKLLKNEKISPSTRLNPVVILDRLPEKYTVSNTSPLLRTSNGKQSKSATKNRGKKNDIIWRENSWNEADEEWSNEGSLPEEASSFLNRLASEGEEGQKRQDEPEVDVIDGVKFLSFLHEPDTQEFSCFHPFYHPFFSDCNSENSLEESFNEDYKQKIIPTKTRDITQIKGWRKKLFGNCNEYGMPSEESHENEPTPDLKANDDYDDNPSFKDIYESDHDNLDDFYPAPGTCDEGEIIFDDVEEETVKDTEVKNNFDDETMRSHFELSKVESKAANAESAFQSKGLEEFLGTKSELRIGLLSQYDPNVKVIEKDSPILAVGTLKKDDYVPPWKKMMERQRKRMELLAASKNKRKENADTKNVEVKPKDTLQTELGNKIVWLDDDSESDEVDKPSENVFAVQVSEEFEDNKSFQHEPKNLEESATSEDQIEEDQAHSITGNAPEAPILEAHEIKIEPCFEESTKENDAKESNRKKEYKKKRAMNQDNSPNSSRAKREKKLSWKMLSSLEMDEKLKEVCEEKKTKHKSPRTKTPGVEEPIRISLKHSPDRSSWVINNVISESDFSDQQSKRRRKIRNYSFVFFTEDGVFKDKLPDYDIVNKTVWSRSKILEKELVQFLAEWRNPLVFVDSLQRYECKTDIDEVFPDLTEEDTLRACQALNRLQSSPETTTTAKINVPAPILYPKLTNYSELTKKKVSRFEQLQNSLKFMDLDPSLIPQLKADSSTAGVIPTELNSTKRKPSKNYLGTEYEKLSNDEDTPNVLDPDDPEFNLGLSTVKRKKLAEHNSPLSQKDLPIVRHSTAVKEKNGQPIVLEDSNSSDETNKHGKLVTKELTVEVPSSSSDDSSRSQEPLRPQTVPIVTEQQPVVEKNQSTTDEIIEIPTPKTVERAKSDEERAKSDEEVAVVFKKRPPKDPTKKRKRHNRELQKTLILKSFRQVISGNTVLKSFIVANTNITSKAKDNMSLGLCAVGLTLNKGPDVKNDIFLLYGRINDQIYNEAVKKSFYEEQHGIETHHTVVPIVLEITKAAMKSSNDLKLVRIPLKGRALIDNQLESVPLMIYPVATKPPDEDLVEYSKNNENSIAGISSEVVKAPEQAVTASHSTRPNDVSILKEVRRPQPEKITLSSGGEESPKKKCKVTTSVVRSKRVDKEDEIDILSRSDEETSVRQPIRPPHTKKAKFMALNRTEPIRRMDEKVLPRLKPRPSLIKNDKLLDLVSNSFKQPTTPLPNKQMQANPPVFTGTFGASRALATLKTFAEEKKKTAQPFLSPKDRLSNGKEVSLIKAILSDQNNGSKKDLKLLTTKQLSEISEIVDSVQPTEPVDPNCDHELRSAAEAAWQIVGPCIVRRVKLRNGNVVYVYKSCQAQQMPGFSSSTQQQNFSTRPPIMIGADAQSRHRQLSSQSKEELVKSFTVRNKSVKSCPSPVVTPIGPCIGAGIKIISPPVRGAAISASEASKTTVRPTYETNQNLVRPKIHQDFGSPQCSNLVSPIKVLSPLPYPRIENASLTKPPLYPIQSAPLYTRIENASMTKPPLTNAQPIVVEEITFISNETKNTTESKSDVEILETPAPTKEISNDTNTSVWIGTDGEPCYVMRLDNDDDNGTHNSQEESKIPTIMECFPISEEEFQRCDASNPVEAIT